MDKPNDISLSETLKAGRDLYIEDLTATLQKLIDTRIVLSLLVALDSERYSMDMRSIKACGDVIVSMIRQLEDELEDEIASYED